MDVLKRLGLVAVMVFATLNALAQQTEVSVRRIVELNPKSEAQKILINVEPDIDALHMAVTCRLAYGQVTVELYDPKGKRMGKLSLGGTSTKEKPQEEEGKLDTTIKNPLAGEWKIMVLPVGAKARLNVSSRSSTSKEPVQK
jgi:hypothetical protein